MLHSYKQNTFVQENNFFSKFSLLGIYSIFFLLPWYYRDSGSIQPVDFAVLLTSALFILHKQVVPTYISKQYCLLIAISLYLAARYLFAAFTNQSAFIHIAENIYYVLLCTLFLQIFCHFYVTKSNAGFYQLILNFLVITTLLPLLTFLLFGADYGLAALKLIDPNICRPVLTFNNANQLGFFALVNFSILFFLNHFAREQKVRINKSISLLILNINLLFLFLSVSRAASPAIFIYLLSYPLIFNSDILERRPVISSLCILGLAFLWLIVTSLYHHLLLATIPAAKTATKVAFLQDLHHRAIAGIQYVSHDWPTLLFGTGSLFNPERLQLEFHNDFFSLLNQGGLVASIAYVTLMASLLFSLLKRNWIYTIPLFCYLTYANLHYAWRNRLTWLFFAMLLFTLIYKKLKKLNHQ